MITRPLGKTAAATWIFAVLACASAPTRVFAADVVSLGNDTYSITEEAGSAFVRNDEKLKVKVTNEANKYCSDHGKEIKIVSLTSKVPTFSLGYAQAKIVFRALNAGDPALTAVDAPVSATAAAAPAAERHLTTDELYSELLKLDDLRKKGILTDDEFQAEKKKLLARSN